MNVRQRVGTYIILTLGLQREIKSRPAWADVLTCRHADAPTCRHTNISWLYLYRNRFLHCRRVGALPHNFISLRTMDTTLNECSSVHRCVSMSACRHIHNSYIRITKGNRVEAYMSRRADAPVCRHRNISWLYLYILFMFMQATTPTCRCTDAPTRHHIGASAE